MPYDQCPQCGDDQVIERNENVVQCRSCRTPLAKKWMSEEFKETAL